MRLFLRGLAVLCISVLCSAEGRAAGRPVSTGGATNDKPQSKLWYHDGTWWSVAKCAFGVAIHEKVGDTWQIGAFVDAVLTNAGTADVRWNGTELTVLVYSLSPRLYRFTYDADLRTWNRVTGYPIALPAPPGTETMVLEEDSTGRLWMATESSGQILAYHSGSGPTDWTPTPVVLQSGVDADDICSIIALGDGSIGVFWSDQLRDEYGFRRHVDTDPPTQWQGMERVLEGVGIADDHVNLAMDASHRVYAITKDDSDRMRLHRRSPAGAWETHLDVTAADGTRGIVLVSDADRRAYILYTGWGDDPHTIQMRVADLDTLEFAGTTRFLAGNVDMNDVTGTKQVLPPGVLEAWASSASGELWANGWGEPTTEGTPVPLPPGALQATLAADPLRVDLHWQPAPGSAPHGYQVYRQAGWGDFERLTPSPVVATDWTDTAPPESHLTYRVTAVQGPESSPSTVAAVDNRPVDPPGPVTAPEVTQVARGLVAGEMVLWFDEGEGQSSQDLAGRGNAARLGSSTQPDVADPQWVAGVGGSALRFDGVDDYLYVAHDASLQMDGSFTIDAWIKREAPVNGTLVNKGTSGSRTYRVQLTGAGAVEFRWEDGNGLVQEVVSPAAVFEQVWTHVACVYDAAAQENRIYVDGVLLATGFATGAPASNNEQLHVGTRLSGGLTEFFGGCVDQLRIARGALYDDPFLPATDPQGGAEAASTDILVRWEPPVTGGPATAYAVYRTRDGNAPQLVGETFRSTAFVDTQTVEGVLCYRVEASNAQHESAPLSEPSCTQVLPPPPGSPSDLQCFLQSGDPETVLLGWQPSTTGSPAVAWAVQRSSAGEAFTMLTGTPVTSMTWIDSLLAPGEMCWRVVGIDAQGRSGEASGVVCLEWTPPAGPPPGPPEQVMLSVEPIAGMGLVPGTVAYGMDSAAGQVLHDATGNGLTAQRGSSPLEDPADPQWTAGVAGGGLRFDGQDDRVLLPHAPELDFTGSFTIEAWARRTGTGNRHCIVSKGDRDQRNYWLQFTKSGYIEFGWETQSGSNHGTMTRSTITDPNWHHIAGVYDQEQGESRIYVDGVLWRSESDAGTPVVNLSPVVIGARVSDGALEYFLDGSLDLVRLSRGAVYHEDFEPPLQYTQEDSVEAVVLSWSAPSLGDAVGYEVRRRVDGGVFVPLHEDPVMHPGFTDAEPVNGALCYEVRAVDVAGQMGDPSAPVCVTYDITPSPPPPAAPTQVAAAWDALDAEATVTWTAPPGSGLTYLVHHAFDGGIFEPVTSSPVGSTSWTQSALAVGTHCWRITARDSLGQEGPPSVQACLEVQPAPAAMVQNVTVQPSASGDSVRVQWDPPSSGDIGFWVVQRQQDAGDWIERATLVATPVDTASHPSWWEDELLPGTLCYRVAAVDTLQQTGGFSAAACIDIEFALPEPPAAPTGVLVTLDLRTAPGSIPGVAVLPFDEADGRTVEDRGTASGTAWLGSTEATDAADPARTPGVDGNALLFDGADDHAVLADAAALDLSGSFTIEAWAQRLSSGTRHCILGKGDTDTSNYWLRYTKSGYIEFRWESADGSDHGTQSTFPVSDTEWHHVAAVWDQEAGENRLYLDGVRIRVEPDAGTPVVNDDPVILGARYSLGEMTNFFDGSIDGVRISGMAQYNADFIPPVTFGSLEPTPVVHWDVMPGSAGYHVERSRQQGPWERLTPEAVTGTPFADVGSPEGDVCYRIRAVDGYGQPGAASEPSCTVVAADPDALPAPPSDLAVTLAAAESDTVQLSWMPAGLDVYRVFRTFDAVGWELLAELDPMTSSWSDVAAPVGNVCYRLTAVDSLGREGTPGEAACVEVIGPLPDSLAAPANLRAVWSEIASSGSGIAVWDMNGTAGQWVMDMSGSGRDAQLGAQPEPDAADPLWQQGVTGGGLRFDGVDDHLRVADDDSLDLSGSFTIEAWVQRASSGTRHCILGKGDTNTSNYWLRYTKSGYIEFRWETADGDNHGAQSSFPVQDGDWHHIAAVYDLEAGESRLYLDGVRIKVVGETGTPVVNDDPVIIGARYSLGSMTNFFDGSIDAVRISGEVLYDADFVPETTYGSGGTVAVVDVSWEPPAGGDAVGYRLERRDADGQPWKTLQVAPVLALQYRDIDPPDTACYRVVALDAWERDGTPSNPVCPAASTAKVALTSTAPWTGAELQGAPNPFNPATTIHFRLPAAHFVSLDIFDVRGRRVRRLLHEERGAGAHAVLWQGRDEQGARVASGAYFVLFEAGDMRERLKLIVLK